MYQRKTVKKQVGKKLKPTFSPCILSVMHRVWVTLLLLVSDSYAVYMAQNYLLCMQCTSHL